MTRAANLAEAAGSGFAFRNIIINGNMGISQRGSSFSGISTAQYTLDRWKSQPRVGAVVTVSQVADQTIDSFVMPVMQHNVTTAASDNVTLLNQYIEDGSITLLGQTVTLSFYAKVVSGSATITPSLEVDNGTYSFAGSAKTLSSSFQRFTQTFTLSGYTASISNSRHLRLAFSIASGIASIQITGVQLEKGTVATPFEFRPYGAELALCQRYFEILSAKEVGSNGVYAMGNGYSATQQRYAMQWQVEKRAAPSISISPNTSFLVQGYNINGNPTAISVYQNVGTKTVYVFTDGSLTVGYGYALLDGNGTSYFKISSEL